MTTLGDYLKENKNPGKSYFISAKTEAVFFYQVTNGNFLAKAQGLWDQKIIANLIGPPGKTSFNVRSHLNDLEATSEQVRKEQERLRNNPAGIDDFV